MPERKLIAALKKQLDKERNAERRLELETQIVLLLLVVELKNVILKIDRFITKTES